MAELEFLTEEFKIADNEKIKSFLLSEGINFGKFELTSLSKKLAELSIIPDEDRPILIAEYPEYVNEYSQLDGYRADVICLSPEMHYIDFVLDKFKDIHFHFENEHWHFVEGSCGFAFLGSQGRKYVITISAGEFITVPEGKWQWLIPPANKKMKSIRFFNSTGVMLPPVALSI